MSFCSGNDDDGHIGIEWTAYGCCPLCASHRRIRELEDALRDAANSLYTLSNAYKKDGFEDLSDVRGCANSRWATACETLNGHMYRCSRCGCMATSHEQCGDDLGACKDCECTKYEP